MTKINGIFNRNTHAADESNAANKADRISAEGQQSGDKDVAVKKDKATVSDKARMLSKLQQAMEAVPDVREERVAALKKQIQEGTYDVPADEIAKRLLPRLMDFD